MRVNVQNNGKRKPMEYVIRDLKSLEKLQHDSSLKMSIRKIRIDLSSSLDIKQYEHQLNESYFACGCKAGSITLSITILVILIAWLIFPEASIWGWWQLLFIIFSAALIGKMFGLILAKFRLRYLIKALRMSFIES